jgi:predicted nucleic acid-binding protein
VSRYVVDASVAMKWFVEEPWTKEAERILHPAAAVVVPELFFVEMANIAWKKVRRGDMDLATARMVMDELPLLVAASDSGGARLARRAFDLAHELQHPAYDCLYLATAEAEGVRLVTADHAFCEHVRGTVYESSVHPIWTPVPPDDAPAP